MSIWGKVIGGAAGFALGGPIGALIGALSGHMVDKMSAAPDPRALPHGDAPWDADALAYDQTMGSRQVAFAVGVIVLGAKLAKADGVVSREEIATFKRIFHIPNVDMAEVGRIYNEAKQTATGYEPYAQQIAGLFRGRPAVLEELLEALYLIALADGTVHQAERDFLQRVGQIFRLSPAAFERIEARHRPDDQLDPYEVLGVARNASDADIKSHHRKLVLENHPDKLIAQGMPPEFIDLANDKLAAINAAYDSIREQRGLS